MQAIIIIDHNIIYDTSPPPPLPCCVHGTRPMCATIVFSFRRHHRHRRWQVVGGDHCNFHPTKSLPAEDGIADWCVTRWTIVVKLSAGKEAAAALTMTPGPCIKPIRQPWDAAWREVVLKPGWKKLLHFASLWEGKRDLLHSTKMDIMRLRNESTLSMLLVEISTESIYWSEYLCWSGYVAPQIGMIPKPVWGCPQFGILTQTDLGIPVPIWGLAFLVFFQSRTRLPFLAKN